MALPAHLRNLAQVSGDVALEVPEPVTQRGVIDALEAHYQALKRTIRHPATRRRRPFIRFFPEQFLTVYWWSWDVPFAQEQGRKARGK